LKSAREKGKGGKNTYGKVLYATGEKKASTSRKGRRGRVLSSRGFGRGHEGSERRVYHQALSLGGEGMLLFSQGRGGWIFKRTSLTREPTPGEESRRGGGRLAARGLKGERNSRWRKLDSPKKKTWTAHPMPVLRRKKKSNAQKKGRKTHAQKRERSAQ